MLKKFLKPIKLPASADFGILILRVGISCLMLTHGYAKLSGYLGGDSSFADPIGIGEELSKVLTILAEFGCSILLILGLFTRAALIPLIITMIVVVFIVHGPDPFAEKEHAISFLITYLTLFFTGPGKYSIDNKLYR
ncbi:DoxX family protein [Dyadobacter sp. CY343]|uniref:DoxX family protein n=1 Tax=Dyadobacter sp. CY343 TaxID=2907299 RepID=UPI001F215627|nr:DoxX family protein [Dyadobacter sp. CY343]MCE7061545.1 DoxX family protein [Dyadobacter sp. CY343]